MMIAGTQNTDRKILAIGLAVEEVVPGAATRGGSGAAAAGTMIGEVEALLDDCVYIDWLATAASARGNSTTDASARSTYEGLLQFINQLDRCCSTTERAAR
jgi:hypothetical protein